MVTKRVVVACLGMLVWFALTAQHARAGDTDCSISGLTCGFGAVVAVQGPTPLVSAGFTATFSETVFFSAGVYTYVYTISDISGATLHGGSTGTGVLPTLFDRFDSTLSYGIVTDLTSGTNDDTGFDFAPNNLFVGFNHVAPGTSLTFYAQSTFGPTNGVLGVINGASSANNTALDPLPEPTLASLLGSSLVFMLGVPLAGWLRQRNS
jgi:hypothetical protein